VKVKRGWVALGAVVLLGVTAALAPRGLRRLDFFRVRRVEVVGARYLIGTELVAALSLRPLASLFDDVEPVRRAALKVRGVRGASVSRRWPGTLVLKVKEAEPVALTQLDQGLALVDERGRVLPFDPTRAPADLPVAEADPVVARMMGRIREADPEFFGVIVSASRGEDREVILEAPDHRFLLRGDASTEQIRALAAVAQDLARKGRNYRELDARYADRVFVRGMKS
jgi:cell division protein FtsQ